MCMDVGASTGGFTDCMLQNGGVKVYSIDVGYGQLDWSFATTQELCAWRKPTFAMWYRRISRRNLHFPLLTFPLFP